MFNRISPAIAPPEALARIILLASLWLGLPARAGADPYYTVTDLGLNRDWQQMSPPGTIESLKTGATYPFATSTQSPSLTDSERASLPGVNGLLGATNSQEVFFPMKVIDGDASGTVIGGLPTGTSRAMPYSDLVLGYALLSPSGQWSKFIPLSGEVGNAGIVELSQQANRILVADGLGSWLVNPVNGSKTPLLQLVSPDIAKRFVGDYGALSGKAIDDRGDILAVASDASGYPEALLLTPPGLAAPAAAPEPSTLVVFALLGAATIVRLRRRRPADHAAR